MQRMNMNFESALISINKSASDVNTARGSTSVKMFSMGTGIG